MEKIEETSVVKEKLFSSFGGDKMCVCVCGVTSIVTRG